MPLSPDSAAQLQTYGQIAVGFAGFAGVIGAFSKFRMHAQATAFRIRGMVAVALMEVIFALLPSVIAGFGATEAATWRVSAGIAAVAATALLAAFDWHALKIIRAGHLRASVAVAFSVAAAVLIAPLYAAAAGFAGRLAAAWYFALMFLGMVVCAYHFVRVMIAVKLDDSE